ncbi:CoA-transferase [Burkholderia cenocepacia]
MSKFMQLADAIAPIPDGATIMVGGFGSPGTPFSLLAELQRQRKRDLTIIKNDANQDGYGVSRLIEAGVVRRLLTTHLGLSGPARRAHLAGRCRSSSSRKDCSPNGSARRALACRAS